MKMFDELFLKIKYLAIVLFILRFILLMVVRLVTLTNSFLCRNSPQNYVTSIRVFDNKIIFMNTTKKIEYSRLLVFVSALKFISYDMISYIHDI